ncbi:DUF3892 domain-containing protein [Corallococcus exiguus]|uniref:DUF3892 domain-containing protein n=1 Tax=Corallococcus exiguus TaxID=83462 RepID=UPI001494004B|nr:DUF3892 domain-containing protein [Corallococcus exiguus]NPD22043.1 DUF3892 domain-containing protein [Corallococcus exiguus]
MGQWRIVRVEKAEGSNDYTGITAVETESGKRYTVAQVISLIKDGNYFYTQEGDDTANVVPVPSNDPKYIRTVADGVLQDNLLELPGFENPRR